MPRQSTSGLAASMFGSTIPLRTVSATSVPTSTAPANSQIPAMMTACLIVTALEPTAAPMEFATSFAPMVQAT